MTLGMFVGKDSNAQYKEGCDIPIPKTSKSYSSHFTHSWPSIKEMNILEIFIKKLKTVSISISVMHVIIICNSEHS